MAVRPAFAPAVSLMRRLLPALAVSAVTACAPLPGPATGEDAAAAEAWQRRQVVEVARTTAGAPYRFGGNGEPGFDCSGLIHFAYAEAGVPVPRTVAALRERSRAVPLARVQPGDLLFFRLAGKVSHVGLYMGRQRFLHAPSRGERVSYASLREAFWRGTLEEVGRVLDGPP